MLLSLRVGVFGVGGVLRCLKIMWLNDVWFCNGGLLILWMGLEGIVVVLVDWKDMLLLVLVL